MPGGDVPEALVVSVDLAFVPNQVMSPYLECMHYRS
jgi:hypothetical protein